MTSLETSVTRATATNVPTSSHWEKEFFTTWLRLMERQKDETDLTQALQSLLTQDGDAIIKLQDAKHHANMMSANDKTMTELMAQLNEFFFRDIVPALKKMRRGETTTSCGPLQRQEDPLDRYLEHGDDGTAMSQAFVDDMSGWAVPVEADGKEKKMKKNNDKKKQKKKMKKVKIVSYVSSQIGEEEDGAESENDEDSDDEIPSDMFHDMLIANSLKLTAMQAPDYSTMTPGRVCQQQVAAVANTTVSQSSTVGSKTSAHSPTTTGAGRLRTRSSTSTSPKVMIDKGKVKKTLKFVPSPARIYLSSRSRSGSGSTPRMELHSPSDSTNEKNGRIGKIAAANLVAEQVLDVRTYGTIKEYLIRWQGMSAPLWIARRKAPPQAKGLIDAYAATLRRRDSTSEPQKHARGGSPAGRKKSSRNGANMQMGGGPGANEPKFYTVDHIVNHRTRYNKRQYLVRWENYSESSDTWENAAKLRIDVPEIVEAYEEKVQADDVHAAVSETVGDAMAGSKPATKRRIGNEGAADKSPLNRVAGERTREKRRRITTNDEDKSDGADEDMMSEDDCDIDLEEAELEEEFSDGESADD